VVVIRVDLIRPDIFLEGCDGDRVRISRTRKPEQVETVWNPVRKGVDILVPGTVKIAAKQHVIVLQLLLALAEVRPLITLDDYPSREMDDRKAKQPCQAGGKRA